MSPDLATMVADERMQVEALAHGVKVKRDNAYELEREADEVIAELVPRAQAVGMTIAELASLCGFKTRKAVYDAVKRRAAG